MMGGSALPLTMTNRTSLVAETVKNLPTMQETQVWSLSGEDPLEKEMATHSSILAWRIPWTEEPAGLQSIGLQRVGHNWVTNTLTLYIEHGSRAGIWVIWGFPGGDSSEDPSCQCRTHKRHWFYPWVRKIPWRRAWQPTPVFLPGESHGQRSLVGYSPWGRKELNRTEAT